LHSRLPLGSLNTAYAETSLHLFAQIAQTEARYKNHKFNKEFAFHEYHEKICNGSSCSGKTTLIKELENKGLCVLNEVAKKIISERWNMAQTKEEFLKKQILIFNEQTYNEKKFEKEFPCINEVFLDRSLIDCVSYSMFFTGKIPDEFSRMDLYKRYSSIFSLKPLPFIHDGLRIERDGNEAWEIHKKNH